MLDEDIYFTMRTAGRDSAAPSLSSASPHPALSTYGSQHEKLVTVFVFVPRSVVGLALYLDVRCAGEHQVFQVLEQFRLVFLMHVSFLAMSGHTSIDAYSKTKTTGGDTVL